MVAVLQSQQEPSAYPYPDSLDIRSVVPVSRVAEALEISEDLANDYIEKQQLPVTRVNAQWGLNVFTCDKLIGCHLKNKQKEIRFRLFPEISNKLPQIYEDAKISEISENIQEESKLLEMNLPKSFSVIKGRKKSMTVGKALEAGLNSLPGGKVGGKNHIKYLEAIASEDMLAKDFIEAFANCYPNVSRARQRMVQEAQTLLEQA